MKFFEKLCKCPDCGEKMYINHDHKKEEGVSSFFDHSNKVEKPMN